MMLADTLIGPDKASLLWWQEADRGLIVFVFALVMIRTSGLRSLSQFSPLDTAVTLILGSNLSRTLTGNAPFWPTLFVTLLLVVLHRILAQVACRWPVVGRILKGSPRLLIASGELERSAMRAEAVTVHDIEEAARLRGLGGLDEVDRAMIERNGAISVKSRG